MSNELVEIINDSGLEKTKADFILEKFQSYFKIAAEWEKKARDIIITNDEQKAEMEMARVGRLFLKEKRVTIEKTRKELKEQSLREGKAIDGIANILKGLIEPIENYLDDQENFTKNRLIAEEKEKTRLELARIEIENWEKEQAILEADRIERERMKTENERLKLEAIEREKAAQVERQKLEKERIEREKALQIEREKNEKVLKDAREKAEKERQERLKIQAEMDAKRQKDEALVKEEKRKIAAAKKAPDKVKIKDFIAAINTVPCPTISDPVLKEHLLLFYKNMASGLEKLTGVIEVDN